MMKPTNSNEQKRGYLKSDFELFHLRDMKNTQFEYHYHDFNKIIIFISGGVTYLVEGKAYHLKPWDILFISSNEIHKAMIDPSIPYERAIIWINPVFLENHSNACDLFTCFRLINERDNNLLRLENHELKLTKSLLAKLEESCSNDEFGYAVLKNSILLHLLILLTRELLGSSGNRDLNDIVTDETVQKMLNFINEHIQGDLSVETLSSQFFLNRYHLMHKFKQQTGFSIHSYILQKRLIKADQLIRNGTPAIQASELSGFNDYSNFVRAYKKMFGMTPKKRAKK